MQTCPCTKIFGSYLADWIAVADSYRVEASPVPLLEDPLPAMTSIGFNAGQINHSEGLSAQTCQILQNLFSPNHIGHHGSQGIGLVGHGIGIAGGMDAILYRSFVFQR